MGRFETEILTARKNLKALMNLSGMWIDRVHEHCALDKLILDPDSSVSQTYGRQEGSAYNGHFICTCYHPLFCFNHLGDLERVLLRKGNVASADDWRTAALGAARVTSARDGNVGGSYGGEGKRCAETPTGRLRRGVRGRIGALQRGNVSGLQRRRPFYLESSRPFTYADRLRAAIWEMSVDC